MDRHAGSVVHDPHIAVVELVANCWDAGAARIEITWPEETEGVIVIADDGVGMSDEEFRHRWMTLNYDRVDAQGRYVDSGGAAKAKRRAFGRNGIGRHAPFFFADAYVVDTRRRDEAAVSYRVTRADGATPYNLTPLPARRQDPGTTIRVSTTDRVLSVEDVRSLLGTRFIANPEFEITLNGDKITLTDLSRFASDFEVATASHTYRVLRIEYDHPSRTADLHGVAFWTNGRLVGNPAWDVSGVTLLDARTAVAKKITYVVLADQLDDAVKQDWSGYFASSEVVAVEKAVIAAVKSDLHSLTGEERKRKKIDALRGNKNQIARLPVLTQERIAAFAERIQEEAPSLSASDLEHAVQVLAGLESASSGFSLLRRLAELDPDDIDTLDRLLAEWTVHDLALVADELRYRLELIARLEQFLDRQLVDEVHELLPFFERGLWIFGPEFEAVEFMSNRALTTMLRDMFSVEDGSDLRRPDVVAPIEVFACDAFDDEHEADGFETVLIVELKRIPHTIIPEDKDQAMSYARAIRNVPSVGIRPRIVCWVLGSDVRSDALDVTNEGSIEIRPFPYARLLRRAHARTFNLLLRLEEEFAFDRDADLATVMEEGASREMFPADG